MNEEGGWVRWVGGRGKCWGVQDSSEGGLTEEGEGTSSSVLYVRP